MLEIILGVLMLIVGAALAVLVLMQTGKDKQLSGSISGMSETYFGKNKAHTKDKMLSNLTIIAGILFVVLDVALYIVIL